MKIVDPTANQFQISIRFELNEKTIQSSNWQKNERKLIFFFSKTNLLELQKRFVHFSKDHIDIKKNFQSYEILIHVLSNGRMFHWPFVFVLFHNSKVRSEISQQMSGAVKKLINIKLVNDFFSNWNEFTLFRFECRSFWTKSPKLQKVNLNLNWDGCSIFEIPLLWNQLNGNFQKKYFWKKVFIFIFVQATNEWTCLFVF